MIPIAAISLFLALQAAPEDEAVAVWRHWVGESTKVEKPEALRITDEGAWQTFWGNHTRTAGRGPRIDFKTHMVLVLPQEIPESDTVVQPKSRETGDDVTGVQVSKTAEALKIRITLALKTAGKAVDKKKTVLTILSLPISPKAVEVSTRIGPVTTVSEIFPGAAKLEAASGLVALKGTLAWITVEGGAWVIVGGGKNYDLHYVPPGFKSGDSVEINGREPKGAYCVHMCGRIFDVESMKLAK